MNPIIAGPICTGLGCTGLMLLFILIIILPILLVAAVTVSVTYAAIKIADRHRSKQTTKKQTWIIQCSVLSIVGLFALVAWQLPKTSYWQGKELKTDIQTISQEKVYIPAPFHRTNTKVHVIQSNLVLFTAESNLSDVRGSVKVEQKASNADLEYYKNEEHFTCGATPSGKWEYCINKTYPGSSIYQVRNETLGATITIAVGRSEQEELAIIDSLEPHSLGSLERVYYYNSGAFYETPYTPGD